MFGYDEMQVVMLCSRCILSAFDMPLYLDDHFDQLIKWVFTVVK